MTGREILDWLENNTLEEFEVVGDAYYIKGRNTLPGFRTNLTVSANMYLSEMNLENTYGDTLNQDLKKTYDTNPETLRLHIEKLELRMKPQPNDPVNQPSHYKADNAMEVIKIIEEVLKYIEGSDKAHKVGDTIKYICRHQNKGKPKEDLNKAIKYLEMLRDSYDE
jgi:hypothetical protein